MKAREAYFRPYDNQMIMEMYAVRAKDQALPTTFANGGTSAKFAGSRTQTFLVERPSVKEHIESGKHS